MAARPLCLLFSSIVVASAGCAGTTATEPGGRVAIAVAPLSLPGVTQAEYRLTVKNRDGQTVFDRQVDSRAYGSGSGSLSYVGPCDADPAVALNTVELTLLGLYSGAGGSTAVDAQSYVNPGTVTRSFTCQPNADVAVDFDLTILRRADQGFFDVAVAFSDIFCSAKLDCEDAAGDPLALLHDGTGGRGRTVVVALACTGDIGAGGETWLYHDPVGVSCDNGSAVVDPGAGPGNLSEGAGITSTGTAPLFAAAVYRGTEQLGFNKRYWNVLLGVKDTATDCTVTTQATASPDAFAGSGPYTTPAGATWPYITWSVHVTAATTGATACTTHPVNGAAPHDGVATEYADADAPEPFAGAFGPTSAPAVPTAPGLCTSGQTDCALPSCFAVLLEGAGTTDGTYAIDPDGPDTGAAAFDAYCDMTTDGGGWTLVARAQTDAITDSAVRLNRAVAVGTLTAPDQATSAKLSDVVINALRGDYATSLVRTSCGATVGYFQDPDAFSADVDGALAPPPGPLNRCAPTWDATTWYDAGATDWSEWGALSPSSGVCGGYLIWYYNGGSSPNGTCYSTTTGAGAGTTWVRGQYPPVTAAGASCAAILAAYAGASSRFYAIDPDGAGAIAPFAAYCDMDTASGGWTAITPCDALNSLGGTMVAVDAADTAGIDASCRPYTQDAAGSTYSAYHTYTYTFDFPAGYTEILLDGYVMKANATPGRTSDVGYNWFTQTVWTAASGGTASGDVSFGTPLAAGPVESYARHIAQQECQTCETVWPDGANVYAVAPSTQLRIGWGEEGNGGEGWFPWWAGTIRLR